MRICFCFLIAMIFLSIPHNFNNSVIAQESGKTVKVAPNDRYAEPGVVRFLWGKHYREAWSTPTTFKILNLSDFAGGLTPVKAGGGGQQTKVLLFEGADGKRYAFRSVDKDPTAILPEQYRETIAADIIQDQISATHPAGALVTDYLEEQVGILHAKPFFFVLPDDQSLGEYHDEFAGMLGMLVERPGDHVKDSAIFGGADEVGNGNVPFDKTRESPNERVNTREFLKARLFDIFIGDWDRHRWQWRWAKTNGEAKWKPIPEDRDQAFSKFDGLLPSRAHYMAPQIIGFRKDYPNLYNLHYNGREVDRRFLVDLEKTVWDSVALALQAQLTDDVIESAVKQLPPQMYDIDGAEITENLKNRRDKLPEAATDFYNVLATEVEIHMTDVAEKAVISGLSKDQIEIKLFDLANESTPYYHRKFDAKNTKEIRLRMHAGNDIAMITGNDKLPVTIRIIGGPGDDEVNYESPIGGVKFYDQYGSNTVTGNHGGKGNINDKPFDDWEFDPSSAKGRAMPLDWGGRSIPLSAIGYTTDYGFLLGLGVIKINYGFRKNPYAHSYTLSGAATTKGKFHLNFKSNAYWENSNWHTTLIARASQLDVIRFFGFGNDTENTGNLDFYQVDRWQADFDPMILRGFGKGKWVTSGPAPAYRQPTTIGLGLDFTYSATKDEEGTLLGSFGDVYGAGDFGQVGAFLLLEHDTRNIVNNPTSGKTLNLKGTLYPELLDVTENYGFVDAVGSVYLGAEAAPLRPVLALRAGGRKIWGKFPFFHSAFLGGKDNLRGYDQQRFAGDASAFGGGDFRFRLFSPGILSITDLGLFGFGDAGRVWVSELEDPSPGGWHTAFGGGIWLSFIGLPNTSSLAIAKSKERTTFYFWWGFAF